MIKARIVKLGGTGLKAARSHLRYLQRDGVARDGTAGALYDAERDAAEAKPFLDRAEGDRHQFRIIVAPEDGAEYEDLRDYTRRVMLLGRNSRDTPVADIMTAEVITVAPETSLGECLHIVTRNNVRHLPVLSGDEVVGLVSIGDLVSAVVAQQVETIASLKSFIGSDYPN
jgi:hypothetical protein